MSHLTQEQRYTISCLKSTGKSYQKIGDVIGKDKSVIWREVNRNKNQKTGKYDCDLAQRKAIQRQKEKPKKIYFTQEMKVHVDSLIRKDYSPEQIVGFSDLNEIDCVSHERIYQYIWEDKKKLGSLYNHLRRKGRKNRKRGNSKDCRGIIKNRVSIDQRPKRIENRDLFGDLEVDLVMGKNHKHALLTINDRASGMLKMTKVESKQAPVVTAAIIDLLTEWIPYINTITADNGKEFAGHSTVAEALSIDYYFAHPYHSWERGSNENLNGLVRQYFPKGSDFKNLSQKYLKQIETKINSRPRKRFGYQNPIFEMNKLLFNQKVALVT